MRDAGTLPPPDAVVDGLYQSDIHSTLHVPADTLVRLLPFLREAAGDVFKSRLRLNSKKATHLGNKGSKVSTLV